MPNQHNTHTGNMLSSNQGMLQGCGGCTGKGDGVVQARGIVGRQKGGKKRRRSRGRKRRVKRGGAPFGSLTDKQMQRNAKEGINMILRRGQLGGARSNGYGMSARAANQAAHGGMGYGSTPVMTYEHCGTSPAFKMGAGRAYNSISALQKGAGKAPLTVQQSNNLSNAGYGYKGGNVKPFAGSYAPVSSTSYEQTCQRAGKRRTKRRRRGGRKTRGRRAGWKMPTSGAIAAAARRAAGKAAALKKKAKAAASKGVAAASKGVAAASKGASALKKKALAAKAKMQAPPPSQTAAATPPPSAALQTTPAAAVATTTGQLPAGTAAAGPLPPLIQKELNYAVQAEQAHGFGGGGPRNLFDAIATPFNALGEMGHNALRDVTQSSTVSALLHPPQAGGRTRRKRRRGGAAGSKVNCWSWPGAINCTAAGGRKRRTKKKRRVKRRRTKRRGKRRGKRRTKRRGKRRRRRRQRGGYAQYQSNVPLTSTLSLPAGAKGGAWTGQLASPPTYSRLNDCHNNYNHFTGKNSPSSVFDKAAPPVPTLGGN